MHPASSYWPLFDLVVTTPRLTLRYVDDALAVQLAALAAQGVHPPEEMPFSVPWTRAEAGQLERQSLQYYWRTRADTTPDAWELLLAVCEGDDVLGVQGVSATAFGVTRTVATGSWLGRRHQGRGVGKEMRAAVLHLAFAGLGADLATTSAFADNPASLTVTRALGYRENGWEISDREGAPAWHLRFVMERGDWEQRRRDDVQVQGLEPCLPLLGVTP